MKGSPQSTLSELEWWNAGTIVDELDVDAHLGRSDCHVASIGMLQVCSWQLGARIELTENLSHDGGLRSVVSMRQVFALQ